MFWLLTLLVPGICAVIGWFTNVLAVKMLFRPREVINIMGLKIQGVIPKHKEEFGQQLAEVITEDFLSAEDIAQHIDVATIWSDSRSDLFATIDKVLSQLKPHLGSGQLDILSDDNITMLKVQLDDYVAGNLAKIKGRVQETTRTKVDLTDFLAKKFASFGSEKLESITYRVASRELKFIEIYGGIFGFLIGFIQLIIFNVFPVGYTLPVFGAVIGVFTNYLAIKMLLYPRNPTKVGPFTLQGLFPKRQKELAIAQAKIASEELILVDEVFETLLHQYVPKQPTVSWVEEQEVTFRSAANDTVRSGISGFDMMFSAAQRVQLRDMIPDILMQHIFPLTKRIFSRAAEGLDVEAIMSEKIADLSSEKFEQYIVSLFSREELALIVSGGVLGALMGIIQLLIYATIN